VGCFRGVFLFFIFFFFLDFAKAERFVSPVFRTQSFELLNEIDFYAKNIYEDGASYFTLLVSSIALLDRSRTNSASSRYDTYEWLRGRKANDGLSYLLLSNVHFSQIDQSAEARESLEKKQQAVRNVFPYLFAYKKSAHKNFCPSLGLGWQNIDRRLLDDSLEEIDFHHVFKGLFRMESNDYRYYWTSGRTESWLFTRDFLTQMVFYRYATLKRRGHQNNTGAFCMLRLNTN